MVRQHRSKEMAWPFEYTMKTKLVCVTRGSSSYGFMWCLPSTSFSSVARMVVLQLMFFRVFQHHLCDFHPQFPRLHFRYQCHLPCVYT